MKWVSLLHFYQPANIESEKVLEATEKSYERIIRALEEHENYNATLNISACLLERWANELGRLDLIDRIKVLLSAQKIELVGSAAYHCLLPLVTEAEAMRQITEQEQTIKKYFGRQARLKGFFLPELAYTPQVSKLIKKSGYEWIILDQIALVGEETLSPTTSFIDKASGLTVILRNRLISESYIPDTLNVLLDNQVSEIAITACDAELLGLRHIDQTAEYEKLLKRDGLQTSTISKYLKKNKPVKSERFRACSWQSTDKELSSDTPFALWSDSKNKVHVALWELASLAQELEQKNPQNENIWWCRWHLVRGLASCVWWWASKKDFSEVFGPIAWSPDEIERGVNELVRSIRTLEKNTDRKTKIKAEDLALKIRKLIWHEHWK